jgi:hypothetical protein
VRLVTGENGPNKVLGPLPVLFAGVGPCAEKALAAFARLTRSLTVSIQGPFGLVLVDPLGEVMFTGDWPWIADFRMPEALPCQERSESIGLDDTKLPTSLSGLMRRLRAIEPSVDAAGGGRIRMNSYVLVDLSIAGAVPAAVQVVRALRQTDPAHDMTILGLTARTAATDATADEAWFGGWTQLLAQLQDEPCTQRIYLLDGCDADKMWFERPEQLHHLCAEFLLYHGLTCRTLLRQNERAITGANENLLNVCGSFGCHALQVDLSVVAERIAERLAREDLSDLYRRTVPKGWLESVEEQAQTLVDKMAAVCEKAHQTQSALSGVRREQPVSLSAGADLSDAVTKVVAHVCSREPLVSLCHFFKCLGPRLEKLLTRQRLWERIRTRRLVVEAFRRQEENTYEPLRQWLSDPQTRWVDRFTPQQGDPPQVVVSRPARVSCYFLGCLLLVAALAGIVTGSLWPDRLLVIGGGLLAVASAALMVAPTGWVRHTRGRIREGQDVAESATPAPYRRRVPGRTVWLAGGLVAAGLAGVAGDVDRRHRHLGRSAGRAGRRGRPVRGRGAAGIAPAARERRRSPRPRESARAILPRRRAPVPGPGLDRSVVAQSVAGGGDHGRLGDSTGRRAAGRGRPDAGSVPPGRSCLPDRSGAAHAAALERRYRLAARGQRDGPSDRRHGDLGPSAGRRPGPVSAPVQDHCGTAGPRDAFRFSGRRLGPPTGRGRATRAEDQV